jgi:GH35 family endo-1,4-beta-xylanase
MDTTIRQHRAADAEITFRRADGSVLANTEVTVAQTRHKFLFGTAAFELARNDGSLAGAEKEAFDARVEKITALCNAATFPFYWARFEPEQGKPETAIQQKNAQWCIDHGMVVKGHPLVWHTLTADWLMEMSTPEILKAQLDRIQRDVTDFKGLIDTWDVINEVVIMPIFDKYDNGITRLCKDIGRIEMVRSVFKAARLANPDATLLINDFDMSPAYDILVEGCLEAGIDIDVIGVQSHMHQGWWGVEKTQSVLSHFERFNLPIHFTETTLLSGHLMPPEIVDLNDYQIEDWPSTPEGEARQVEEAVQHYKTLFAHPLVESITWWDLFDGGWLGAPAGLVRKDGTAKPAYDEIMKLVKGEWWTPPTKLGTDADGRLRFTGTLGDYEAMVDGQLHPFTLDAPGERRIDIQV